MNPIADLCICWGPARLQMFTFTMRQCFSHSTSMLSPTQGACTNTPAKEMRESPCPSETLSKDPAPTPLWPIFFHYNLTEKSNQNIPLVDPRKHCFSSQCLWWSTIFCLPRKWIICFMLFPLLLFVFKLSAARIVSIKLKFDAFCA